ncbi:zinc finger HIT domain-containing protein 1 isoform X2 [Hylobates moloch]|uniref:zinc finger HIT domain-containing protein 1 isoform X2 n=1 Tax=Hylobates moloch TaxID=81572 RepID=UPI0013F2522C|nr:zinc finger HIT domain-containing protein 1 isoform X2 [Hylobates moloch]
MAPLPKPWGYYACATVCSDSRVVPMVEKKTSVRSQDPGQRRVLDRAARQRRINRQLEALENDNFQDDPHAGLPQLGKRLPQFDDDADTELECGRGPQLPDGLCGAPITAPAPLLCCLWLPFPLHLCQLRRPVLHRALSGDPPGDQVSEVDRVSLGIPREKGLLCTARHSERQSFIT